MSIFSKGKPTGVRERAAARAKSLHPEEAPAPAKGKNYAPPQRGVRLRVFTPAGWTAGTYHLPRVHSLLEHMTQSSFLKLTDVRIPGHQDKVPFFALSARSALCVVPPAEEEEVELKTQTGERVTRHLTCLLPSGALVGELDVLKNVRLSDYLANKKGWLVLHDVSFPSEGDLFDEALGAGPHPVVFVNAEAVIGVAEEPDDAPGAGEAPPPEASAAE